MRINQLKPGIKIRDWLNGRVIHFEVVSIKPIGQKYEVTFSSPLGQSSAVYPGTALVAVA
jgi:hypothetical protein